MDGPVSSRAGMIAAMEPELADGSFCFVSASEPDIAFELMREAIATFREPEGLSLVVPAQAAERLEIAGDRYALITLQVHSALDGVGLTAAVSSALAGAGIACNVIAAFHHDHLFVPLARAEEALRILRDLQSSI